MTSGSAPARFAKLERLLSISSLKDRSPSNERIASASKYEANASSKYRQRFTDGDAIAFQECPISWYTSPILELSRNAAAVCRKYRSPACDPQPSGISITVYPW